MDSGSKSSYIGKMPQYRPKSVQQFNKYKLDLLSLLPVKKETQTGLPGFSEVKEEEFRIHPNPVHHVATFEYNLKAEGRVNIVIYNADGIQIQVLDEGITSPGMHLLNYNSNTLDAGVYYCSLLVDRIAMESRKMVVIR